MPPGGPGGPGRWPAPPPGGSYAPSGQSRAVSSDDTLWAVLSHVSFFVIGLIGPLVVMLTKGNESRYIRDQAVEALNFHISVALASVVSFILMFVLIGFLLLPAVLIGAAVLTVMAAIAVGRGEAYRYPVNLRLVK
ncbi:MAG: DUF4870 domain-containing protein [Mycobacteriales bacterium]